VYLLRRLRRLLYIVALNATLHFFAYACITLPIRFLRSGDRRNRI